MKESRALQEFEHHAVVFPHRTVFEDTLLASGGAGMMGV